MKVSQATSLALIASSAHDYVYGFTTPRTSSHTRASTSTSTSTSTSLQSSSLEYAGGRDAPFAAASSGIPLGMAGGPIAPAEGMMMASDIWESPQKRIVIQGNSLKTCTFDNGVERVLLGLRTDGRPLNANIELWQGPDNAPQTMALYIEDGSVRPFCGVIETPRDVNCVAVYNTGMMEFPMEAVLDPDMEPDLANSIFAGVASPAGDSQPDIIQGGALKTTPFPPTVASVQIVLKTDGRPLNARIELLQGPNNKKQVMDIYTDDGMERPFNVVLDTPGTGNVVRIVNTATMEYPMYAQVEPYMVEEYSDMEIDTSALLSWDA